MNRQQCDARCYHSIGQWKFHKLSVQIGRMAFWVKLNMGLNQIPHCNSCSVQASDHPGHQHHPHNQRDSRIANYSQQSDKYRTNQGLTNEIMLQAGQILVRKHHVAAEENRRLIGVRYHAAFRCLSFILQCCTLSFSERLGITLESAKVTFASC